MFEPEIEDAPCERCWKPVHLQHDPPCDHGWVQCGEHDAPDCCVAAEWDAQDIEEGKLRARDYDAWANL